MTQDVDSLVVYNSSDEQIGTLTSVVGDDGFDNGGNRARALLKDRQGRPVAIIGADGTITSQSGSSLGKAGGYQVGRQRPLVLYLMLVDSKMLGEGAVEAEAAEDRSDAETTSETGFLSGDDLLTNTSLI